MKNGSLSVVRPNHISKAERFLNAVYAAVIIVLGAIGLTTGELLIPGRRSAGPNGLALEGPAAWAMYAAMICACVVLLSVFVDHYDRRDNAARYRGFAQIGKILGWSLFCLSLALYALG